MPAMRKVYSSHVSEVGYDEATRELHVTYSTGKTAAYQDVPPEEAQRVLSSASIGESLHAVVRGRYQHRYVGPR